MDLNEIFTWPPTPTKWGKLRDFLKSIRITGGVGVRVSKDREGTIISAPRQRKPSTAVNERTPFYPTLTGSIAKSDLKITMVQGYVHLLEMGADDAVQTIEVANTPIIDVNELPVSVGYKIWVTAAESVEGLILAPTIASGATWAVSTAPKLIGGTEDDSGSEGTRIWRLCEVVLDGTQPKIKIYLTGVIIHAAARMLENAEQGVATANQGKLVKEYSLDDKQWKIRGIKRADSAPDEMQVNQVGDWIELRGNESDAFIIFKDCDEAEVARIEVKDGFVKIVEDLVIPLGGCPDPYSDPAPLGP